MKTLSKIITTILLTFAINAFSQESQLVEVTVHKTATLVFPSVIKSVDRGSLDLLARKAPGVENILQLKAARTGFPETNLTVVTADGHVHEFTVKYAGRPTALVSYIESTANTADHQPLIFDTSLTEYDMERMAENIIARHKNRKWKKSGDNKIEMAVNGFFIHNDVMFCHMNLINQSEINYDIKFIRFYIKDKKRVKREASQEWELKPLFIFGNDEKIIGKTSSDVIYALEKFTIPDAKQLVVELFEKNGGRNLRLVLRNKHIIRARPIN